MNIRLSFDTDPQASLIFVASPWAQAHLNQEAPLGQPRPAWILHKCVWDVTARSVVFLMGHGPTGTSVSIHHFITLYMLLFVSGTRWSPGDGKRVQLWVLREGSTCSDSSGTSAVFFFHSWDRQCLACFQLLVEPIPSISLHSQIFPYMQKTY